MKTELQRIGKVLGINTDVEDNELYHLIQDKIKKKNKESKKNEFCYYMVKAQNKKLESEIKNLHNEFAESIGIHEHMMVKQSRDNFKKENKKLLMENYNLRKSIEQYRENELKDKLKRIEGVR